MNGILHKHIFWVVVVCSAVAGGFFWQKHQKENTPIRKQPQMQTLVNFWATWCAPCTTELPLLAAFAVQNPQFRVELWAIDSADNVTAFMKKNPNLFVKTNVKNVGIQGMEQSKNWGNLAGVLPFSVLLDADGEVQQRKIGAFKAAELAQWGQLSN